MLEEWLFLAFGGVILVFIYAKMVYYSSLYGKINEEHEAVLSRNRSLEDLLRRFEGQVDNSVASIHDLQTTIKDLRIDLKETVSENKRLKKQVQEYKVKVEFLYSQIEKTS
jgi:peptidoglycan hydrolase CwlO-like protein